MDTVSVFRAANAAAVTLSSLPTETKRRALRACAEALRAHGEEILRANAADIETFGPTLGEGMTDRLRLTPARIEGMAHGMEEVASLPDPVGEELSCVERPNGLKIRKVRVPLGTVGIIYESRPNVTSDAAALCFMSGNACVLRPGKEAFATSFAIVSVMKNALAVFGVADAVCMPSDSSRQSASDMMHAVGYLDVLIPRGGAGLIRACVENATVPCIQTGTGICHVYVDKEADLDMALNIIENAKTSRPSVCNAEEVLLVHRALLPVFLPKLKERLVDARAARGEKPVELRLDADCAKIIDGTPATPEDFHTEFLDYILAVGAVESVDDAIEHIRTHSTHHSEAIITADRTAADRFIVGVDSAAVYVNASTRFTDGGEFGLGCEIGISTQKLHARGPMGLSELTTYKYITEGSGQIR